MQLADGEGLISGVTEGLRHRRQDRHLHIGKDAIPVDFRWTSRHQCAPRRHTYRCLGVGPRKSHAVAGQLIERRRLHTRMTTNTKQGTRPVIRRHEQYMRMFSILVNDLLHPGLKYPSMRVVYVL